VALARQQGADDPLHWFEEVRGQDGIQNLKNFGFCLQFAQQRFEPEQLYGKTCGMTTGIGSGSALSRTLAWVCMFLFVIAWAAGACTRQVIWLAC